MARARLPARPRPPVPAAPPWRTPFRARARLEYHPPACNAVASTPSSPGPSGASIALRCAKRAAAARWARCCSRRLPGPTAPRRATTPAERAARTAPGPAAPRRAAKAPAAAAAAETENALSEMAAPCGRQYSVRPARPAASASKRGIAQCVAGAGSYQRSCLAISVLIRKLIRKSKKERKNALSER